MRKVFLSLVFMGCLLLGVSPTAFAAQYAFDCEQAQVKGSIRYTVIGHYKASFSECRGLINYDEANGTIKDVTLEIDANSISSNCAWCDKIVLSKRLLDAQAFPKIIYKSEKISQEGSDYKARGMLEMHGIAREFDSDFTIEKEDGGLIQKSLRAKGQWVINRKDFDIVWSKTLDRGGVLVSDEITVDWHVQAWPLREAAK